MSVDILVTIPFGIASDRGQRRLVLCLNICGLSAFYTWIVCVGYLRDIPVITMLFGPLFSLIGGGDCVFMSTVAAVVTKIAPEEGRRFVLSEI
jgi:MFS family permease